MKKEKIKLLYFFQKSGNVVLFNEQQSLKNDFGRVFILTSKSCFFFFFFFFNETKERENKERKKKRST